MVAQGPSTCNSETSVGPLFLGHCSHVTSVAEAFTEVVFRQFVMLDLELMAMVAADGVGTWSHVPW